jgi:threonine/homoserine/homoserine lactone efflux protein
MDSVPLVAHQSQTALIRYLLIGITYALSAGLQPGPLQAFFLARVARQGWKRTLPAAFAPLLSDGPIALISITLLQMLPASFRNWLQLAGGILLLFYARSAFATWRHPPALDENSDRPVPGTILQAALINLFNPHPYLGWSLVMGPEVIAAWDMGPWLAAALLGAFYIVMISTSLVVIFLMGQAVLIGPGARQTLSLISALLLAGLGGYFLIMAAGSLLRTIL